MYNIKFVYLFNENVSPALWKPFDGIDQLDFIDREFPAIHGYQDEAKSFS